MASPVITIAADKTIKDAALKMWEHKIGSLIIKSDGNYDIITERDVLKAVAEDKLNLTLDITMEDPLITVKQDAPIGQVAQMMLSKKIRHLAVEDEGGKIVGLLTVRDVVTAVHESFLALLEA